MGGRQRLPERAPSPAADAYHAAGEGGSIIIFCATTGAASHSGRDRPILFLFPREHRSAPEVKSTAANPPPQKNNNNKQEQQGKGRIRQRWDDENDGGTGSKRAKTENLKGQFTQN